MLPSTCYDELYEFSKWDKFTKERPMTRIFYHGKTYTYDKLPSFPKFESKPKQKPERKKKNPNKTSVVSLKDSVSSVVSSIVDSLVTNVALSVSGNLSVSPVPVPEPTVSNSFVKSVRKYVC